jgi:hypothetical protein
MARDWLEFIAVGDFSTVGMDFALYRDAAARWLGGGPFYNPYQVAAPYVVAHGDILYPPPFLLLVSPFTRLPGLLWWTIPIGALVWVIAMHRPRPIVLAAIVLCVAVPSSAVKIVHGNPVIWMSAAVALASLWNWPAVLVLLKPTLFPFALIGFWAREWWVGLAGAIAIGLLFLPMWPAYVAVIQNARDPAGPLYSFNDLPLMAIPVVAWLGGRRHTLSGSRGSSSVTPATT